MPDRNMDFAVMLVDALARLGVEHVCITPGSRSTPLVLAFADDERITDWSHHDERSSAFFALGLARTTRAPVAIVTTSGTAAAELYPAVVEARYGRVPLLCLTADRPAELRDTGAPQTIDQRDLFGRMVTWSQSLDAADADPAPWIGALAARMVGSALGPPPGPVHLDIGFREPLMPVSPDAGTASTEVPRILRPRVDVDTSQIAAVAEDVSGRRGVVVAGPQDDADATDAAVTFASSAGWPILADPLSGLRTGAATAAVIGHGDAMAWEGWLDRAKPEAVVRFGANPTSKPIWRWLEENRGLPHVFIEPFGWRDPTASATTVIRAEPAAVLNGLAKAVGGAPESWVETWISADAASGEAIDTVLADAPFPNEPAVARSLGAALPDPSLLWVASSMPIRDVDAFLGTPTATIRVLANRGVNGVDGFVSSALGSAASAGPPVTALAGDISVLHDVGALATMSRLGVAITIVAMNNDGGGIFHFLPQEGHRHFEKHFGTPHGLSLTRLAEAFGVDADEVADRSGLVEALRTPATGPRLLEVRTDRRSNVELHREIRAAVAARLDDLGTG